MLMTLLSNRENLRLDQCMAGFKLLACKLGTSQKVMAGDADTLLNDE
jgi:hypothetical protein